MKNRTSLFVLAVEILAIIVLHTMRASNDNAATMAKELTQPAKTELATQEKNPHLLLSTLK
jgi:hypothetical protein